MNHLIIIFLSREEREKYLWRLKRPRKFFRGVGFLAQFFSNNQTP
jgi:hypothetical protein